MASSWLRRHKNLIIILLVLVLLGVVPWLERGIRDPHNRTVGPKRILKLVIKLTPINQIAVCFCSSDKEVKLRRDDGISTAASIFDRGGAEPRPGIILIHGNTALGRNLAMYPVLACKLAEHGYVVLTLDLPGFGESDDPFVLETVDALDEVKMVAAAVQYLIRTMNIENLSIIGHSRGTAAALDAALTMKEIKNIILIGPPRRCRERFADSGQRKYFWNRAQQTHRFVYGVPFPAWYTSDIWAKRAEQWALENYTEYFSREDHKPIMLVDGEFEDQADRIYSEQYYSAVAKPKKFVRLRRSDHYCNTAQSMGLIFYDEGVMDQLVGEIAQWLYSSDISMGRFRRTDPKSCD